MLDNSDLNPYGYLGDAIDEVPISEIHRLVQSRPNEFMDMKKPFRGVKVVDFNTLPSIGTDIVFIAEHNKKIIEGLLIPKREESRAVEIANEIDRDSAARIDLDLIRQRIAESKKGHTRDTVTPKPNGLLEEDERGRAVENIVPISKEDIERSFDLTEKTAKQIGDRVAKHLSYLISFDNAGSYVEAFARDGLDIESEINVDDSPLHFLSQLCSIDSLYFYLKKMRLPKAYKDMYMERVIHYYVERAAKDSDNARTSERLRRLNNVQSAAGQVKEDDSKNAHGLVRSRQTNRTKY